MPDSKQIDSGYANFDITIRNSSSERSSESTRAGASYPVTARYQEKVAEGGFTQDTHQPFWQDKLPALGDPNKPPGEAAITEAGITLFDALIRDDIRDLWMRAQSDIERGTHAGLRIRLALQPPPVAALPWESLYDAGRNQAFAARSHTPLLRIENQQRHIGATRALQAELPIKVLLAIPEDPSGQIDAAQEIEQITSLQETLGSDFIHIVPFTGRFDVIALRRKIEAVEADVLHIVAHGEPKGILFWKRNKPDFAPPSSLRTIVQQADSLKLVFLNACLAGQISSQDAFSTVGPQLLQGGVPAVIAMQFEILDQTAIEFAQFLYEELIIGPVPGAIDAAVGSARSNLYALDPESFGYGTPVLWLNAPNGQIFSIQSKTVPKTEPKIDAETSAAIPPNPAVETAVETVVEASAATSSAQANHKLTQELAQLRNELATIKNWTESRPQVNEKEQRGALRILLQPRKGLIDTISGLFNQIDRLEQNLTDSHISAADLEQYISKAAIIRQKYASLQDIESTIQQQLTQ